MNYEIENILRNISEYDDPINDDDTLESIGISSMNLIMLIVELEDIFHMSFLDQDINFEKLHTCKDLEDYVMNKKGK